MTKTLAGVWGLLAFAAGCASPGPQKDVSTAVSLTTVEQELSRAQGQLDTSVTLLGTLVESPGPAFADTYLKFVGALAQMDEQVQTLRDRTTAMDIRRDEYLRYWLEQTSAIQSPELRKEAEARRTRLMETYLDLNARGAVMRRSYAPLHASLHDCARFLAADPRGGEATALVAELQKIRQEKKDVDAAAKAYRDGLKVIVDKLSVPASGK